MTVETREQGLRERSELARRRGVMSGAEFVRRVKAWAKQPDENPLPEACLVKGVAGNVDHIDLRGLHCERPMRLSDFCFMSTVDLRDARIGGPLILGGSTFLKGLRLGGSRLQGGLDVTRCWVNGPRGFGDARRSGPLDLRSALVEGEIAGQDLWVRGNIDAENVRIKGGCDLSGITLGDGNDDAAPQKNQPAPSNLVFRGAHIEGQLLLYRANIDGQLILQSASVDLDVFIRQGASGKLGSIFAFNARIGGDLELEGVDVGADITATGARLGRLLVDNSELRGKLFIQDIEAGDVRITNSKVQRIDLQGARLTGDLFLTQVRAQSTSGTEFYARGLSVVNLQISDGEIGDAYLGTAQVQGDLIARPFAARYCSLASLDAGDMEVQGYCVLDAVNCPGTLDFSKARLGALRIRCYPGQDSEDGPIYVEPTRARSILGKNMLVNGDVELYGLQIGSSHAELAADSPPDDIDPAEVGSGAFATPAGVINLSNSEIRGDLKFWARDMSSNLADSATSGGQIQLGDVDRADRFASIVASIRRCMEHSRIGRALRLAGAEIRGNLVLSGLTVGASLSASKQDAGLIDLADADIRRNVDSRSADSSDTRELRTECHRFSMRGLNCRGDLHLQGLRITGQVRPATGPAIDGQRVRVEAGGLFLCDGPESGAEREPMRAELPGQRVSLYDGRFSRIVINGRSFDQDEASEVSNSRPPDWPRLRSAGRWAGIFSIALAFVLLGAVAMALISTLTTLPFAAEFEEKLALYLDQFVGMPGLSTDSASTWGRAKWWALAAGAAILVGLYRKSWRRTRGIREEAGRSGALPCELPAFQDIPVDVLDGLTRAASLRVVFGAGIAVAAIVRFAIEGPGATLAFGWIGVFALASWIARQYLEAWVALGYTVDVATSSTSGVDDRNRAGPGFGAIQSVFTFDIYVLSLILLLAVAGTTWFWVATAWSVLFLTAVVWLALRRAVRGETDDEDVVSSQPNAAVDCSSRANAERAQGIDLGLTCLAFKDFMQVMSWNQLRVFPPEEQQEDVSFAQVQVGHLEIVEPIPRLIDFQNLKVDRWSLNDDDPGNRYLELLDHASSYNSAIYSQIEQDLRRHGRRELAENVHRAMRQQEQWRERRWMQTALMLIHSLIGYGTQRGPLIRFMFLWFVFTTVWISIDYPEVLRVNPETEIGLLEIEASEPREAVQALRNRLEPHSSHPLGTRLGRSLAMAVRYHVPIIAWDPWPYLSPRSTVMWAYTSAVMIVHWVLWPLLLASLLQTLIPQRDQ